MFSKQSTEETKTDKKGNWKFKDTYLFILSGIALILLSIIFEEAITKSHAELIIIQLLSHIGVGFIVVGVLGILIDSKHWTNYFEQRLFNISTEKKYLEKLDPEALSNLQAEVLKVYYKNNDLGGADGFINFYQKNVQAFVSSPFRVNANLNFQIDYCKDDINKFYVQETMSWICKSNGGKIQQNVSWVPGESEFEKINDFEVSIQHKSLLSNTNPTGTEFFSFDRLKNEGCTATNNMGFSLPLKNYSSIDDLYIIVKVNCIISKERFIAWRMSLPTRGMTLTVQFPKELRMETEFYFDENNPIHYEKTSKSGYYYLHVEDWIMPDQGITIQLLKLNEGNKA